MEAEIRYLKEKEVSKITGIALSTLRNNRSKGCGITYIKVGRSVRYDIRDVRNHFEERKVQLISK